MSKNMPSTITRNTTPSGHVQKHALVIVLGMFLGMFWRCGISCYCARHVFGHVLTVWYFLLLYSACFWTCSDGVVFLVIVLCMFLDMFWRCGISCYCTRHVFGHVLTVWYFLLLYSACFWTCPDGVVFLVIVLGMFLDMFWRCGISCYCTRHVHRQNMSKNMPSTITRNATPSEHVQKHAEYNNKKYHTVRTCPKTCRVQ
jgi:hypothetical protein